MQKIFFHILMLKVGSNINPLLLRNPVTRPNRRITLKNVFHSLKKCFYMTKLS